MFAGVLNKDGPGAEELRRTCSQRLSLLQLDITNPTQVKEAYLQVSEKVQKTGTAFVSLHGILIYLIRGYLLPVGFIVFYVCRLFPPQSLWATRAICIFVFSTSQGSGELWTTQASWASLLMVSCFPWACTGSAWRWTSLGLCTCPRPSCHYCGNPGGGSWTCPAWQVSWVESTERVWYNRKSNFPPWHKCWGRHWSVSLIDMPRELIFI